MTEKIAMGDVLANLNALITQCESAIEQANNKNFRDTLIQARNSLEKLQWDTYLVCKEKKYYVPAAPAGQADIEQVKTAIS